MMDREYFNNRRKERRKMFMDLLGGKCENCGSKKDLHFDHKRPSNKEFRIAKFIDAPDDVLKAEVKKCRLLCSKCHKQKTLDKEEFGETSKHGTIWRYKSYNCRCKKCTQAMSDYNREKRKELLKEI